MHALDVCVLDPFSVAFERWINERQQRAKIMLSVTFWLTYYVQQTIERTPVAQWPRHSTINPWSRSRITVRARWTYTTNDF